MRINPFQREGCEVDPNRQPLLADSTRWLRFGEPTYVPPKWLLCVIGAAFKMAVPLIVIVPGLLALSVLRNADGSVMHLVASDVAKATGQHAYDEVLPLMLIRYCGPGLLGLGITALIAGFMSGMAGNVSAFSAVWTYDLYGAYNMVLCWQADLVVRSSPTSVLRL